jgi:hypothetical protein
VNIVKTVKQYERVFRSESHNGQKSEFLRRSNIESAKSHERPSKDDLMAYDNGPLEITTNTKTRLKVKQGKPVFAMFGHGGKKAAVN